MIERDRRNPYVILGVPFGATEKEARSGFSKMSKRLRQDPEARYASEDLTWALHQIEQLIESPEKAFEVYRIPANAELHPKAIIGVFNPAPHPAERTTEPASAADWQRVRNHALATATRRLLQNYTSETLEKNPYE
jgi:hypothetical protein